MPFAFSWGRDLQILEIGRSLSRFLPDKIGGWSVEEAFELHRPTGTLETDWLDQNQGVLLLLRLKSNGMLLRGQAIAVARGGPWLFAGAPWMTTANELDALGLGIGDFAVQDPGVDLMYLLQLHRGTNRDLQTLNEKLRENARLLGDRERQARRLAFVARRTRNAVVITDSGGMIEWVNEAFERMTGWTLGEVVGRKPGSFLQGPHSAPDVIAEMRERVARGEGFHSELINYRKDGGPYWVDIEVEPITDGKGVVDGFMALESDVTAKKAIEIKHLIESAVSDVIAGGTTVGTIVHDLLVRISMALGANEAVCWWLDPVMRELRLVESHHAGGDDSSMSPPEDPGSEGGRQIPEMVWKTGKSLWMPPLWKRPAGDAGLWRPPDDADTAGTVAIRISADDRFCGVLVFSCSFLSPSDSELVTALDALGARIGLMVGRMKAEEANMRAQQIAQLGTWSIDAVSRRMSWSDEVFRILGYQPGEVIPGETVFLAGVSPEDQSAVRRWLAEPHPRSYEDAITFRAVQPSGRIRCVRAMAETGATISRGPLLLSGTILDITELSEALLKVSSTEARLQLAIESSGLGVWDWDFATSRVVFNDILPAMLEYRPEEWGDGPLAFRSRVHPADVAPMTRCIRRCLRGQVPEFKSELRMRCKSGRWNWVQIAGRVVARDERGRALRLVGTQSDVHIRKMNAEAAERRFELEIELRSIQTRYWTGGNLSSAFGEMLQIAVRHSSSRQGVIVVARPSEGGVFRHEILAIATPHKESAAGLENEGLRLEPWLKNVIQGVLDHKEASFCKPSPQDSPCQDGSAVCMALPLFHGVELVGVIVLAGPSGSHKPDQAKSLDTLTTAVSDMIIARREEMRKKQVESELRAARDRAEAASRAKNDFLAMISHEIRTPMNGILGMVDVLRETPKSSAQTGMIDAIIHSGRALVEIIDDILNFSKIESGVVEIKREKFGLELLLEGVVDLFATQSREKGLDLVTIIDPALPDAIQGDVGRIRQILVNLTGNALKFTEEGYVAIRVTLLGGGVEFSVEDSGIGLNEGSVNCLFQPFSQIDSAPSRRYGGTGLGLAISKRLASLMDGDIGVVSNGLGRGSRFWVRLPVCIESQTRAAPGAGLDEGPVVWIADESAIRREAFRTALTGRAGRLDEFKECADLIKRLVAVDTKPDVLVVAREWLTVSQPEYHALRTLITGSNPIRLVLIGEAISSSDLPETRTSIPMPLVTGRIRAAVLPDPVDPHENEMVGDLLPPLGLKILLAEDNSVNAMVAELILGSFGCHCVRAENGLLAIEEFQRQRFDGVLMDCQMPVMDGYEATRRIRQWEADSSEGRARCWIIAVTANAFDEERGRCLEAGMDDYLSKPFEKRRLYQLLRNCVPGRIPMNQ